MAADSQWAGRFQYADPAARLSQATLKQSTQSLIREMLFSGAMVPGEIYSANSLAAHLGISNSPAREAMMALAAQGLLEPVRNRGFRVVELTDKDRQEVYEMRVLIEVEAVRQAATRDIGQEVIDKICDLAQRTVEAAPTADNDSSLLYLEVDHEFHMALVDALDNPRWSKIVSNLRDQSRVNGAYRHLTNFDGFRKTAREHLAIAQAVADRDPETAAQLMVKHLDYARPGARKKS